MREVLLVARLAAASDAVHGLARMDTLIPPHEIREVLERLASWSKRLSLEHSIEAPCRRESDR